ncbi:hypothetical protein WR25_05849 [Diploscapter pachys]|uniref:Uncharacterized protein n=1 Tax=Diploscapter pachys TaxID=2018661 RepID=A0A2A2L795_9BILA|nr:hypothetical protein WR25_05849 [Diploscapter pachys]
MPSIVGLVLLLLAVLLLVESRVLFSGPDQEQLEQYRSFPSLPMKRNRMCLVNAGLSQGCDLSDILMAKSQANKFYSFAGPGRR